MVQNLPPAEVYEKEFAYMPWGKLVSEVESFLVEHTPKEGSVLDLLCGPGYLIGRIKAKRPDVSCRGVDIEPEFISHAEHLYPGISFEVADASTWASDAKFDAIVCTAGLHHLPFAEQEPFVAKISRLLKPGGFAVIGDPYIDDYADETERKLAGAKLGYEYLAETIRAGGDDDVIRAAIGVLSNDVMLVEFKSSVAKNEPLFKKHFKTVEKHKTWPQADSQYGDYYFILRN